uniref:Uncharacterized protein n=1 Tax=Manihot esculenta TaxID=3983 RepID=A0A2C9V8M6_MANES
MSMCFKIWWREKKNMSKRTMTGTAQCNLKLFKKWYQQIGETLSSKAPTINLPVAKSRIFSKTHTWKQS